MKKTIFLLFFLCTIVFSASAQWSNNPLINTIVNNMPGDQTTPLISYDNAGNFYIGFFSSESGNYNVRLHYYSYDGVAQWGPNGLLVSDNTQNSSLTIWDLITDNNGNCILAFQDFRNGNGNIYAYSISPTGAFLWGADGIAVTTNIETVYLPSLTVTSTNNIIVAWQKQGATYKEVVMQKITPAGTLSWGNTGISYQSGTYSYTAPRLLGVESDQYLMAFYKETGSFPGLTRHIYVQKFNASGTPVWASDALVSNSNGISAFAYHPTIASDGANGIVVAWTDDRNSDNNINAAVNRILSNGTSTWPANGTEVSNINSNSDQNPQILGVNGNNEVMVTWSKKNGNQSQTAIAGQKFSSTGVPMWTNAGIEFVPMSGDVFGTTGGAVFDGTNAMIVYEEFTFVKALAVDNSGNMIWTPTTTLMAGRSTNKGYNVLSGLYNDQLIATWVEDNTDIFMQNIYTDGSLGDPPISSDATLSDLTVDGSTVNGFSPDVFNYSIPIPTGAPLPITGATTNFPAATLSITQTPAVPGTATVLVTAENGTTQLTYTIDFYVAGTDATLIDLTVDNVTIAGFDPAIFNYDYPVPTGDPIPTVGATASDPNAELIINQATALPGSATVIVTSEDELTTNTYTVNYLYTPNTDATLADLLVGGVTIPGFDPLTLDYTYSVIYPQTSPYTLGIPADPLATIDDTQCISIPGDAIIVVTAEDGIATMTYTVHYFYVGFDATLSDLTVDGVTIPGFDPGTTAYMYVLAEGAPVPQVDGTPTDPLATLFLTQAIAVPGQAALRVVAQDGVNETTYTVSFYTMATDATLADLTVDGETIEGFDPAITYYEVDVYEGEPIPTIDGTPNDPLATTDVNQSVTLPGDGTILVTAQDGITQLTYTVHFNLITGIADRDKISLFVYPNPVDNRLSVAGISGLTSVDIMNLLGEVVFSGNMTENQSIDADFLTEGIYFARIRQQNEEVSLVKFVKK